MFFEVEFTSATFNLSKHFSNVFYKKVICYFIHFTSILGVRFVIKSL